MMSPAAQAIHVEGAVYGQPETMSKTLINAGNVLAARQGRADQRSINAQRATLLAEKQNCRTPGLPGPA